MLAMVGGAVVAAATAPTMVIPLMAFAPLIKGVCKVGGTLVIISKPTKLARTNT
jgi:hypothetical protein